MSSEPTITQQRRWARQWKRASRELEEQHVAELRNLSEAEALRQSDAMLELAPRFRRLRRTSGLVKQQALFRRLLERSKP